MKKSPFPYLSSSTVPFMLALICLLAYGLLVPWLGLYADDWTFLWTSEILQTQGELRYFTVGGNRPVWGIFYHFFIPLLGHQPWVWHIFGIFWLWVCAILVWWLFLLVWPQQKMAAFMAAALFAVYPGMQLQFISLTLGHMWLIYAACLASLSLSVLAVRRPERYLLYASLAVITAAINLLSFEYFIMLELVRPVLLWIVIGGQASRRFNHFSVTIKAWLPYALLFAGVLVWRSFFFVLQTIRYQYSLFSQFSNDPNSTALQLITTMFKDVFWETTLRAWGQALALPFQLNWSSTASWVYLALSLFATALVFAYLARLKAPPQSSPAHDRSTALQMVATGLFALFAGGWPFWMTGLEVAPVYWNSRFTMPFILGVALSFSGLVNLIPWRWLQWAILALLVGFAAGSQFQVANDFRRDWLVNSDILRQLSWRIPGLPPGTTLLSDDLPLRYYTDNTLSAQLNWIAAKGEPGYTADYYLGYISEMRRFGQPYSQKGLPIRRDMISIDFYGNTDAVVGIHYQPGSCLRVLDPRLDPSNLLISEDSREAAKISNPALISLAGDTFELEPAIYGPEPKEDWCYTVQKAALAHQQANWEEVASLGDRFDLQSSHLYRDPMIAVIFIEGYFHTGDYDRAIEISQIALPGFDLVLCRLWLDFDSADPGSPQAQSATQGMLDELSCLE